MDILTEGGGLLQQRDYTLIIDKSEKMSIASTLSQKTVWSIIKDTTIAIADECEKFDFDGLTFYLYADDFQRYNGLSKEEIEKILSQTELSGVAQLFEVLNDALNQYFSRRSLGYSKPQGETFIVITASYPVDEKKVEQIIIEASKQMNFEEELGISFIQIGADPELGKFLQKLDDDLVSMGAKFDICDTITIEKIDRSLLASVLLNALID
ncbi:MAG: hypothetical protein AB4062_01815 [Crocosphaera sp.]